MEKSADSKFSKIKDILSRYALPLIYGFVVMKLIFTPYLKSENYFLYIGFGIYECLLFWIFEKIKPKKKLRALIYIVICIAVFLICRFVLTNMKIETRYSFIEWFYLDISTVGEVMPYVLAMFFALGLFVVSIIYYFTIIRFRSLGLLLVSIFPFSIYGKRSESLDAFSITLMLTVFLALVVHARQVSDDSMSEKNGKLIINKAYLATVALFVTFAGAVTMVLPKPQIQSQLEKNKELFNFQVIKIQKTDYDDLNDKSSPRFGANATGEVIFNFTSNAKEDIFYLRRQSFDMFKNNQWVDMTNFRMSKYAPDLENDEYKYFYNPEYVRNMTFDMLKRDEFKEYGVDIGYAPEIAEKSLKTNDIYEYSDTYGPSYIPSPLNTDVDQIYISNNRPVYYTYRGDKVLDGERQLLDAKIHYTIEDTTLRTMAEKSNLTWIKYKGMLEKARNENLISEKLYEGLINQYYMYKIEGECSDKIKELAHKITDNCESDYAKAVALVDYFQNNGFVYDLDYEPEDESIDYFLFTSKKGNCTSYATAMTLMARSVGLPARYVEGFAVNELSEDGKSYVVRDSCAHAYVEVLIPGFSWMTFDPTVSGFMDQIKKADNTTGINGGAVAAFMSYFSKFILFFGVVFVVVIFVLLDRIFELVFRIRFKLAKPKQKVLLIYTRCMKLLENSSGVRLKGKTPGELAEFALSERNADISEITEFFKGVIFGGKAPNENELNEIYTVYKNSYKLLCKKPKERNSTGKIRVK